MWVTSRCWPDAESAGVLWEGKRLALFRLEDGVYALDDVCSHEYSLLSEGEMWDGEVSCPKHGSSFDISTGAVRGPSCHGRRAKALRARVEKGGIFVELDG